MKEELSKDSDTQEQYDRHHKPCDNLSHDCHIEYDTLSHDRSCWNCEHCEFYTEKAVEKQFCHHEQVMDEKLMIERDCPLWSNDNGKLSR